METKDTGLLPEAPWHDLPSTSAAQDAQDTRPLKTSLGRSEGRRSSLDERQRELSNRIATLEKLMPVMIAKALCREAKPDAEDPTGEKKVRKIVKEMLPKPDPAEELAEKLTERIKQLNDLTAEMHNKIINTSVQIEDYNMEIASIERSNRELDDRIEELERKLEAAAEKPKSLPKLEPVTSEDRFYLSQIRKFDEEELQIKREIKEMEDREYALRAQIEALLGPSTENQRRKHHAHRSRHRHHKHKHKKKDEDEDLEELFAMAEKCGCGRTQISTQTEKMKNKKRSKCKCGERKKRVLDKKPEPLVCTKTGCTIPIPKQPEKSGPPTDCDCDDCSKTCGNSPSRQRGSGSAHAANLGFKKCDKSNLMKVLYEYTYGDKTEKLLPESSDFDFDDDEFADTD